MVILERHTQLAELAAARRDAAAGRGNLVLVTGEAGVGKTVLVKTFAEQLDTSVLWGMCDELLTPRPLGPFRDMFPQLNDQFGLETFLDAVLRELSEQPAPVVAVVEDAHWADQATLDTIRFLGRRVGRMRALLVVTYRDDEVPADHPLRVTLGAIPCSNIWRVRLAPLSEDAVTRLAHGSGVDAVQLYELTGGNPLYVTESLANPDSPVPPSVQDAVMARVGRLDDLGCSCAELASAVPGSAESWLLDACGVSGGLDEAVRLGVLRCREGVVTFSHELARRAVEMSLGENHRRDLNGKILDALAARDADPARLTHHAVQAGQVAAVVRYAPQAARRAAALGAHLEAFEHYLRALAYAEAYTADELLELLDSAADAGGWSARFDEAYRPAAQAVELCRNSGDQVRLGRSLCLLSEIEWARGRGADARAAADEAVAVLGGEPAGAEQLVGTYALQARLAIVDNRVDAAIAWGDKAIALTGRHDSLRLPAELLISVGTARLQRDPDDSGILVDGLRTALDQRDVHPAARAYVNLAAVFTRHMRYADAWRYIDDGLAYVDEQDQVIAADFLKTVRAFWYLDQGRWREAELDAASTAGLEGTSRFAAELVTGLLQTRRGDPSAAATLNKAARLAEQVADTQVLVPVALARAELAWLSGEPDGVSAALTPVIDIIFKTGVSRWIGEAALWQHRVGLLDKIPAGAAEPYALHIAGRWREAAEAWANLGRPYDQADALAEAPERPPLLEALAMFDRLGAAPWAAMVRRRLTQLGVQSVPRGPREATRASPGGLTRRQTEVLRLLADNLTYQAIAGRLYISIKTVDHHVTAIRAKLGAADRDEAVAAGRRLDILP
jgi:DNA-binding CsgD family transcriptional regulator